MKKQKLDPYIAARDMVDLRLEKYRIAGITPEERVFVLAHTFKGEVDNGGFDQFLFNSSGDYALETVEALEKIGAYQARELLLQALDIFSEGRPPKDIGIRRKIMDRLPDETLDTLRSLDDQFYKSKEDMLELLLKFTETYPSGFPKEH